MELALPEVEARTAEKEYSDDELAAITRGILLESAEKERAGQVWVGKNLDNDWDEELYIKDLYEQFLQTVQQERPLKYHNGQTLNPKTTTFEEYLGLCLETLVYRREELKTELAKGDIDARIYNNAKMLAEMAEEALKKYLEKSETGRLIGV